MHPDDEKCIVCNIPGHVPVNCKEWLTLCPDVAKRKIPDSPKPRTGSARPPHDRSHSEAASVVASDTASSYGASSVQISEESEHPDASGRQHSR